MIMITVTILLLVLETVINTKPVLAIWMTITVILTTPRSPITIRKTSSTFISDPEGPCTQIVLVYIGPKVSIRGLV